MGLPPSSSSSKVKYDTIQAAREFLHCHPKSWFVCIPLRGTAESILGSGGHLITVRKPVKGKCKKDTAKLFSEVARDKIRGNWHKRKHRRFLLNIRKNTSLLWGWPITDTHCPGRLLSGHGSGQLALGDCVSRGLNQMTSKGPFQPQPFCEVLQSNEDWTYEKWESPIPDPVFRGSVLVCCSDWQTYPIFLFRCYLFSKILIILQAEIIVSLWRLFQFMSNFASLYI